MALSSTASDIDTNYASDDLGISGKNYTLIATIVYVACAILHRKQRHRENGHTKGSDGRWIQHFLGIINKATKDC